MIRYWKEKFVGDRAFYNMVLEIAVPIMVQNGITNFVSLLDNIMVGQLGTAQMSGVSIANQLIFVYNLCIFGGLAGVGIFTAQYWGRGDREGIRYTFRYKILLAFIITAGAILIFIPMGSRLIQLYLNSSNSEDIRMTLSCGEEYLKIMLFGLPAFLILQVYASTLRECGETVIPMKAGLTAIIVNLLCNYLLIFGKFGLPGLGAAGAAAATVLSRYVEAVIVLAWTHRHTEKNLYIVGMYRTLKIPVRLAKKYSAKGMPLLINEALWSCGMAVLTQCYSIRGLTAVAGLNIAGTINNLFNVVFSALGESVAIIVGHILGTGNMQNARDTDNKMIAFSMFSCIGMALVMLLAAPLFPGLYNTTSEVRAMAAGFIMVQALFMPQNAFLNAAYFTLRAGGKTVLTFVFDCVCIWGLSVPLVYVLSRYTAIDALSIFALGQIAECVKCVIGFVLVKKGIWLQNIVSIPEKIPNN